MPILSPIILLPSRTLLYRLTINSSPTSPPLPKPPFHPTHLSAPIPLSSHLTTHKPHRTVSKLIKMPVHIYLLRKSQNPYTAWMKKLDRPYSSLSLRKDTKKRRGELPPFPSKTIPVHDVQIIISSAAPVPLDKYIWYSSFYEVFHTSSISLNHLISQIKLLNPYLQTTRKYHGVRIA